MNFKICFLAPTGYGKTTGAEILSEIYKIKTIKIATPLYEMQEEFYKKIGMNIGNTQDGELLQFLGYKIRKENSKYLLERFIKELEEASENYEIIINDDCRPNDYEYLKELGFMFIKINGFERERKDHTKVNRKLELEWQDEIPYDYEINNFGCLEAYKQELIKLMEKIKNDRKMLHNTNRKTLQL